MAMEQHPFVNRFFAYLAAEDPGQIYSVDWRSPTIQRKAATITNMLRATHLGQHKLRLNELPTSAMIHGLVAHRAEANEPTEGLTARDYEQAGLSIYKPRTDGAVQETVSLDPSIPAAVWQLNGPQVAYFHVLMWLVRIMCLVGGPPRSPYESSSETGHDAIRKIAREVATYSQESRDAAFANIWQCILYDEAVTDHSVYGGSDCVPFVVYPRGVCYWILSPRAESLLLSITDVPIGATDRPHRTYSTDDCTASAIIAMLGMGREWVTRARDMHPPRQATRLLISRSLGGATAADLDVWRESQGLAPVQWTAPGNAVAPLSLTTAPIDPCKAWNLARPCNEAESRWWDEPGEDGTIRRVRPRLLYEGA